MNSSCVSDAQPALKIVVLIADRECEHGFAEFQASISNFATEVSRLIEFTWFADHPQFASVSPDLDRALDACDLFIAIIDQAHNRDMSLVPFSSYAERAVARACVRRQRWRVETQNQLGVLICARTSTTRCHSRPVDNTIAIARFIGCLNEAVFWFDRLSDVPQRITAAIIAAINGPQDTSPHPDDNRKPSPRTAPDLESVSRLNKSASANYIYVAESVLKLGYVEYAESMYKAAFIANEMFASDNLPGACAGLALFYHDQERFDEARILFDRADALLRALIDQFRQDGNEYVAIQYAERVAYLCRHRGDYEGAKTLYAQSMAYFERTDQSDQVARLCESIAYVHQCQDEADETESMLRRALAIQIQLNDQDKIADLHGQLAWVHWMKKDFDAAQSELEQAIAIDEAHEDKTRVAHHLGNLGLVAAGRDDFAAARALHQQALDIAESRDEPLSAAHHLDNLGDAANSMNLIEDARAYWTRAREIYRKFAKVKKERDCDNKLKGVTGSPPPDRTSTT